MGRDMKRKRNKRKLNKMLKKLKREIENYSSSSSESEYSSSASYDDYNSEQETNHAVNEGSIITDDMLEVLGADPLSGAKVGPAIHQEIAGRWLAFLQNGIDKTERKDLMDKYPVVENCLALQAPKLNLEVQCCLNEAALKQDGYIQKLQDQLGAGISALAIPINEFFSQPTEVTNQYLPYLVDSAKLLTDVHHSLSGHRRYAATNILEPSLRKVIEGSPIDDWLFGDNLSARLKADQEVRKTGAELKSRKTVSHVTKPVTNKRSKSSYSNFRRQLSRQQKGEGSGTWRGNRREAENKSMWKKKEVRRRR